MKVFWHGQPMQTEVPFFVYDPSRAQELPVAPTSRTPDGDTVHVITTLEEPTP